MSLGYWVTLAWRGWYTGLCRLVQSVDLPPNDLVGKVEIKNKKTLEIVLILSRLFFVLEECTEVYGHS